MNKETLAQLNCDFSVLSADNLEAHLAFLKQSLRLRTRLLGKPGIVDKEDPQLIVQSTVKPLWPTFAPGDYTTVVVTSGRAVTAAGDIVELTDYQTTVGVAGLTDGVESVILLRYEEVDSEEIGYSADGIAVSVGKVPASTLSCITKADFLDPTITTADVLDNSVVLGVVQWAETEAPTIVTTQESGYEWNRPWFSPRDVEHRSQVGTGEVTYTNPHGTSINDLAAGAGTHVYDHLTTTGMIWSKDSSVPSIPGILCYDSYDSSTIKRDNTSTKTEGSWFSTFGVLYIELSRYPTSIHKAVDANGDEIVLDHIRGTKTCVLVTDKAVTALTVHYTASETLAISNISASAISFKQIQAPDIAIAQGQACTTVLVPTVPLRKYSLVPREIMFKLSSSGQVFADPSVLLAARGVAASAGSALDVSAKLPVPGAVGIGLMGLPAVTSAACVFIIIGVDSEGTQVSETLYFDNNSYADAGPVPAETEAPTQVQYTKQVFVSVTSVTIPATGDDAYDSVGSATFIVLGRSDYSDSKSTVLATGFWDGQQLVKVRDARRILPVVRDGFYGYGSMVQAAEILPGVNNVLGVGNRAQLIVAEDFAQPNFLDATTTTWDGLGVIDVPVISPNLQVSDKILRCYRSRAIPMRVDPAAPLRLVITLFGADGVTNTIGCVRVVGVHRSGRIAEAIAVPVADDNTGSVFAVFDNVPWSAMSFVISGKCSGFAAYFLRPSNSDPDYFVEFV